MKATIVFTNLFKFISYIGDMIGICMYVCNLFPIAIFEV